MEIGLYNISRYQNLIGANITRLFFLIAAIFILGALNTPHGFAQDVAPAEPTTKPTANEVKVEVPSMIIDPEMNAFRFFIDGKEVARIDQAGLHIRNNVSYGGTINDVGSAAFDEQTTSQGVTP